MEKLDTDILLLLCRRKRRPCEIRKALSSEYDYESRTFDVTLSRRLRKLREQGLVRRHQNRRQNVSYTITDKGRYRLIRDRNKAISEELPEGNVQIEVLRFLMYLKILVVDIMTPYGAPPETYLKNLRDRINDDNLLEQFRELLNDPRKGYAELSRYLERYEKKQQQIANARLKQEISNQEINGLGQY